MDGPCATIIVAVIVGETARPFKRHSDISLRFAARNDDGEALFGTYMRTVMAPFHFRGLEFDIGVKTRGHITFTIERSACVAEVRNVTSGYGRGCWRTVALRLASGIEG
jgi:hypothetical protein